MNKKKSNRSRLGTIILVGSLAALWFDACLFFCDVHTMPGVQLLKVFYIPALILYVIVHHECNRQELNRRARIINRQRREQRERDFIESYNNFRADMHDSKHTA